MKNYIGRGRSRAVKGEGEMRKAVKVFADRMEAVLKQNDHKSGWKNCTYNFLLGKLWEETYEVVRCFNSAGDFEVNQERLQNECADVANIAMMIADNLGDQS